MLSPIFDEAQSFSVIWHNFHVLASVLYLGPVPQSGHYISTMSSSLSLLIADDDEKPRDRGIFAANSTATHFHDLLGAIFDN